MGIKITILASGSGTNAEKIIEHFSKSEKISVAAVLSNKTSAFVLERAKRLNVKNDSFSKEQFNSQQFIEILKSYKSDYIILAGFLWKIPEMVIKEFENKIINIHPSLLPNYGGKGMYGAHVHQSVIENREKVSGITIHLVNEVYDEGRILFQAGCEVTDQDSPDSLAQKIHKLEHQFFPKVVEDYILEQG